MSTHLLRIGVSFTAIVIVYAIYSLVAVPMIEPQVKLVETESEKPIGPRKPSPGEQERRKLLAKLFASTDWELNSPKVLETEQGMLLFQDYQPMDGNRLAVNPFTLVVRAGGEGSQGRPVVIQAPQGAMLQFDQPVDLGRASLGRLTQGELTGKVHIFSPESRDGADDELQIDTHDVKLTEQQVLAPHEVQFRMGRSFGSGRDLTIELKPAASRKANKKGPAIGGVKSMELVHVDRVHLHIKSKKILANSAPTQDNERSSTKPASPLEVACRGPFRFDFEKHVASFRDRVDVTQIHVEGPSDQLNCQLLEIFFVPRDKEAATGSATSLDVSHLVATGSPVVVRGNSKGVIARCEKLEYDTIKEHLSLIDSRRVIIESDRHPIRKVWGKQIHFRPQQQNRVVSILGGSGVRLADGGSFDSEEMHVWLLEVENDRGNNEVLLDRMLAVGEVRLDTPRLSGDANRLEAWFRHEFSKKPAETDVARSDVRPTSNNPPSNNLGNNDPPRNENPLNPLPPGEGRDDPVKQQVRKFDIHGRLIRVQLWQQGKEIHVDEITVKEDVRFTETQMLEPGKLPLTIHGDVLQVQKATALNATMKVVGQPARVSARGMSMAGSNVQLDRGKNRLWIEGEGTMALPAKASFLGRPAQEGQTFEVTWKDGMQFDGRTVRFDRSVKAVGQHQLALAEMMEVTLDKAVDFADPQPEGKVEAQHIHLDGGVYLENHSYDENNRRVSFDQMQVRNLTIDNVSGRLHADGPGWVGTSRYNDGKLLQGNSPMPPRRVEDEDQLIYLHVDFQKEMVGNIHKHELEFIQRVKSVYGPIENWDQKLSGDRRDGLGEKGILMNSDRMKVTEMGPPRKSGFGAIELEANENVWIESRVFTARAHHLTYTQAKELLVLAGKGQNNAELAYQKRVGGKTSNAAAQRIWYWRRSGDVSVDNGRFLDLGTRPSTPSRPPRR